MNYGKLTAGTTKTAIDTAKPSEKGEIITYLSRMGDVLHNVQKGCKLAAFALVAVNAVCNGNEANAMLSKHNFGIKTHLQIISTNAAQILYQHMGNLSGFYGCNHAFPIRAVKVCARPAVISKVDTIRKAMFPCIIFKQLLLIDYTVTVACEVVVAGKTLV